MITSDRKTYTRKCQKGGKWSSSKPTIACERDSKNYV